MGDEGQLVYILFGFSKIFDFLSADGKDKLKVALEKGKHDLKVNFVLIDEGTSLVFISIKEDITLLNTSVQKQILKKKQRCRKWMRYLLKCIFRHREKRMI